MTHLPKVYLAGPLSGLSFKDCVNWREEVARKLAGRYMCLSPMRGKDSLKDVWDDTKVAQGYGDGPYTPSSSQALFRRDHYDVHRCDILLANLLPAKKASIGTMMEIAWAYEAGKFVLLVMDQENIHNHAFVIQSASLIVPGVQMAIEYLMGVLNNKARMHNPAASSILRAEDSAGPVGAGC